MATEQPNPPIDFSHAKEPARSLDINKGKEAAPIEPEEVTGQNKHNPTPDDFDRQEEDPKIGGSQITSANISAG